MRCLYHILPSKIMDLCRRKKLKDDKCLRWQMTPRIVSFMINRAGEQMNPHGLWPPKEDRQKYEPDITQAWRRRRRHKVPPLSMRLFQLKPSVRGKANFLHCSHIRYVSHMSGQVTKLAALFCMLWFLSVCFHFWFLVIIREKEKEHIVADQNVGRI